jgi:protocatechuate 3,4-dioxygenase alpha subunit
VTPLSTVGPFFKVMLRDRPEGTDTLVTDRTRGDRITIEGTLVDGAGAPVLDGLIEIWQADAEGRYRHPDDPLRESVDPEFAGFGRVSTGVAGAFAFHTIRPGSVPGPDGLAQAPHVLVSVLARGIMNRCWTRLYFEGDHRNRTDPILSLVPADRRDTMLARQIADGRYRFDVVLQGERETVFLDA